MKVKVDGVVYDSELISVMVILDDADLINLRNMELKDNMYACFPGRGEWTPSTMRAWMTEQV